MIINQTIGGGTGTGILEALMRDVVAGNNPVDTTELASIETQISNLIIGA